MARLKEDSEDEFPDIAIVLGAHASQPSTTGKVQPVLQSSVRPNINSGCDGDGYDSLEPKSSRSPKRNPGGKDHSRQWRQRPLKFAHVNSLLLPLSKIAIGDEEKEQGPREGESEQRDNGRKTPRRTVKRPVNYRISPISIASSPISSDESTDLSGFIVNDSEVDGSENEESELSDVSEVISGAKGPKRKDVAERSFTKERDAEKDTPQGLQDEGSFLDRPAFLQFIPARSRRPFKIDENAQPSTPKKSVPKERMMSPPKRVQIPNSPHRLSQDDFWSQEVINEWNDQYSPEKPLAIGEERLLKDTDSDDSLSFSAIPNTPIKSPTKQSPTKQDRISRTERKAFNDRKNELALSFLAELDREVGAGQISKMLISSGGIRVIWSKKLNTTAGRASWKKQTTRSRSPSGTESNVSHHVASIELAEKVIDDEDRLLNVIAHEYCHLANFMISGVKDQPHGREFKKWAKICSEKFGDRGIEVTTKHSYDIDYKYVWQCIGCGLEYKRHSKSIDPSRHTCGSCRSKLKQTRPLPRAAGPSEYQRFVGERYKDIKATAPNLSQREIMKQIGKAYQDMKASTKHVQENAMFKTEKHAENEETDDLSNVLKAFKGISIDSLGPW